MTREKLRDQTPWLESAANRQEPNRLVELVGTPGSADREMTTPSVEAPGLSIIVVAWNAANVIEECLQSSTSPLSA